MLLFKCFLVQTQFTQYQILKMTPNNMLISLELLMSPT